MMREDHGTNFVEDAATFEHWRGGAYDSEPYSDRPSRADLAAEAAERDVRDRLATRRRDGGAYEPDSIDKYDADHLIAALHIPCSVSHSRKFVMYVVAETAALTEAAARLDPAIYEAKPDGEVGLWVRLRPEHTGSPAYHGNPPF